MHSDPRGARASLVGGELVTGERWPERIDPEVASLGVVAHHLKKYGFARSFGRGITLDIGCGAGYGTSQFAGVCRSRNRPRDQRRCAEGGCRSVHQSTLLVRSG